MRISTVSRPKYSRTGRELIQALKQVEAHLDGTRRLPVRRIEVPDQVDVRAIRIKLGLSQAQFANRYGFSSRSLQEWEQGRRQPESAVRAYFQVIDRNPGAVEAALHEK